ncbi:hypothetical protein OG625_10295 [Streptomyces sp. NBC_01351]|uniref:hypothetical protein n=1 Tax=Streptomyces sp. NBC_01351 TaxID=2903833 RepID=UPI002E353727|nr:hypothetical protein [Streptomyces sp. NBC_01351]
MDGPGEAGLIVPALAAPVIEMAGTAAEPGDMGDWCADTERAGGAVVLSLDELPEVFDWAHLLGSGAAHGGFMPSLG